MVRVTVKEKYNEVEFDFADCEIAGKFMHVAIQAAVGNIEFKITKVEEPTEEPQEESRFIEPVEDTF